MSNKIKTDKLRGNKKVQPKSSQTQLNMAFHLGNKPVCTVQFLNELKVDVGFLPAARTSSTRFMFNPVRCVFYVSTSKFPHFTTKWLSKVQRVSLLCSSHSNLPRPPGSPLMIITHTGHYVRLLSPRRPLPLLLLQGQLFSSQELPCISFNLILARESTSFYFSKSFIQLLSLLQKETLEPWKCQLWRN